MTIGDAPQTAKRVLPAALIGAVALFVLAVVVVLFTARRDAPVNPNDYAFEGVAFETARFIDLDGWAADDLKNAVAAFSRSCARIDGRPDDAPFNPFEAAARADADGGDPGARLYGAVGDWRAPCAEAGEAVERRGDAARAFFETHFTPVRVRARFAPKPDGPAAGRAAEWRDAAQFTGYFEPTYEASPVPTADFSAPALKRPDDLVMVELGRFRDDLAGRRIAGRVVDGVLQPYEARAAIEEGALRDAEALAYMRPNDLFFLQIQGSGKLRFDGRAPLRIGYDGQNGRPYRAIGRDLIEIGALTRETVSMQTIGAWLNEASPEDAAAMRAANQSYVFFRVLDDLADPALGPLGAQGAQLTPRRSIAVDRRYHGLGAPVFVGALNDRPSGDALALGLSRRLYIAQDVGGAISGPLRGDLYVGGGDEAGEIAGALNAEATLHVLLPNAVAERLTERRP